VIIKQLPTFISMTKSVSFGENRIHEIENISPYLWEVTFPGVLHEVGCKLSELVQTYHLVDILTVHKRAFLIEHTMVPWVNAIVNNRDVVSVEIKLRGTMNDLVQKEEYNRVVIVLDFMDVLSDGFKNFKPVKRSYNHDQTTIEFNIYPTPTVRVNITNMLSF